jgi:hypothetical protein
VYNVVPLQSNATSLLFITERRGRVVNAIASYSGGPRSNPSPKIAYPEVFVVFFSPSRKRPGWFLKLGHYRFLPCPF